MNKQEQEYLANLRDHLTGFVTERRAALFEEIIRNRTRYVTLVLEDIFQPHNASAVLRSCDCFGVQDVHIIENNNQYEVNPQVALGSAQWLTLRKYNEKKDNTEDCISILRKEGYRIIGTTPRKEARLLEDFDISQGKFALMFGTEQEGLTDNALQLADEWVRIPMYGFTESFNISVSAALMLFHFTSEIRRHAVDWKLSEEEKLRVMIDWLRTSVRNSEQIENIFRLKNK